MKQTRLLNNGELAGFFERMELLVRGGISCEDGLRVLRADAESDAERAFIDVMLPVAEQGEPLNAALEKAGRFPSYAVTMVRVGETAGRLEATLSSLSAHYRRQEALKRETVNAVSYPAAMLIMMLAVMAVMSAKVLPVFMSVLTALGGTVSPAASAALAVSEAAALYALIFLSFIALIALAALVMSRFAGGRRRLSALAAKLLPGFTADSAASRFAAAFGSLLSSGLDMEEALEMASTLADGAAAEGAKRLTTAVKDGAPLDAALAESKLFSAADRRLIAIGFKAGTPDTALLSVADRRAESAERRLTRITGAVEPALVAALCIIVGAMLLTAILPLTGLFTAMLG